MDLHRLSTDALASFVVFADHLNFTRAAAELHISQPALHVKVNKLAATIGRPLYRKHGRELTLTSTGEAVARFGRDLDRRMTTFLDEVHGTSAARPVVLAAGEGAYLYLLGDLIRQILSRDDDRGSRSRPPLKLINCDHASMLAAVRSGRADLGVGVLDVLPDDLDTTLVASYPPALVLPNGHPLASRDTLTIHDLDGQTLVLPPAHRPHRIAIERALRAARVNWTLAIEAEGWPLMMHFVALGVGLAIVNGCVRTPPELTSRPLVDQPETSYYAVHVREHDRDPRIDDLLDAITRVDSATTD